MRQCVAVGLPIVGWLRARNAGRNERVIRLTANSPLTTAQRLHCGQTHRLFASASHAATDGAKFTQLICPECGKRFFREAILREHRRARHLVNLPTPEEEAYAAVEEEINGLKEELRGVRDRVRALHNPKSPAAPVGKKATGDEKGEMEDVAYPAAKVHGRILANVSGDVLHNWETRHPGRAIGTSLSAWMGVGTVVPGSVLLGTLDGFQSTEAPIQQQPPISPRVLQFQLETMGYRERRPGQLKMYRNRVVVRHIFPEGATTNDLFTVRERDLLHVHGNYSQHKTLDVVSKSFVENPVVEAVMIGLLKRGEAVELDNSTSVDEDSCTPSQEVAEDVIVRSVASPTEATPAQLERAESGRETPKTKLKRPKKRKLVTRRK